MTEEKGSSLYVLLFYVQEVGRDTHGKPKILQSQENGTISCAVYAECVRGSEVPRMTYSHDDTACITMSPMQC